MLPTPPEAWVRAAQELPAARAALDTLVARAEADAARAEADRRRPRGRARRRGRRAQLSRPRPASGAALAVAFPRRARDDRRVHRKVVTVLFCDVVGSTALGESTDPEALRGSSARYFERMKAIVERHGGTVEKFIGDAVMAVFGVPAVARGRRAARACRAAVEMRDALPGARRRGADRRQHRRGRHRHRGAAGDRRRGQRRRAAAAGRRAGRGADRRGDARALVRGRGRDRGGRPAGAEGKVEPVAAHRLVSVQATRRSARTSGSSAATARARADPRRLGARPGRRSAAELLHGARRRPASASRACRRSRSARSTGRVVRGRCLPYGEGITYWPVTSRCSSSSTQTARLRSGAAAAIARAARRDERGNSRRGDRLGVPQAARERRRRSSSSSTTSSGARRRFLDLIEHVATAFTRRADPARSASHGRSCSTAAPGCGRVARCGSSRFARRRRAIERLLGEASSTRHCASASATPPAATRSSSRRCSRWPARPRATSRSPSDAPGAARRPARPARRGRARACSSAARSRGSVFHRGAVQALAPEEPQVDAPAGGAWSARSSIRPDRPSSRARTVSASATC